MVGPRSPGITLRGHPESAVAAKRLSYSEL